MSFDSSHYQEYLLYSKFLKKSEIENHISSLDTIKTNINTINDNCLNKDFIFILIFEKWIDSKDGVTVFTQKKAETSGYSNYVESEKTSFLKFDSYPYHKEDNKYYDRIPLINLLKIFDILNNLNNDYINRETKLEQYYKIIKNELEKNTKKSKIEKIDIYCNKTHDKVTEIEGCLYSRLISISEKDEKSYFVDYTKYAATKEIFKGQILIQDLLKKIDEIKNISSFNNLQEAIQINNKNIIINKQIILFFNLFFKSVTDLKNLLDKENDDSASEIKINKSYITSFYKIDDLILNLKPAFKKSYIVKENNLSSFISIKILHYIQNSNDFIEINNFNIPYNNIIDLEHNVSEKTVDITLIDTEGELSNLLIYKMYQISHKNNKVYMNNSSVDVSGSYVFQIEYGWSSLETEDEEELLKENVFTKKKFRGFIKSINSRFTMIGTEYRLNITTNDQENADSHMNYYEFFYYPVKTDDKRISGGFFLTLIFLYFILKYSVTDIEERFMDFNIPNIMPKEIWVFEKIFFFLNDIDRDASNGNTFSFIKIQDNNFNISHFYTPINSGEIKYKDYTININKTTHKKDYLLIEKLIFGIQRQEKKYTDSKGKVTETFKYVSLFDIKIENLKNIMNELQENYFSLNSWLVAIYFIWKIKYFFLAKKREIFLFYDKTEIFNILDNQEKYIDIEKTLNLINNFNVFCFDEGIYFKNHSSNSEIKSDFFIKIKLSFTDKYEKYNSYNLYNLNPLNPLDNQNNETFFVEKIKSIFKNIKKLGLNKNFQNSDYQFAASIDADFMSYKDLDYDYYLEILSEYRKKIYCDMNTIYQGLINKQITPETEFKKFYIKYDNEVEKIIKTNLDKKVKEEIENKEYESEEDKKNEEKRIKNKYKVEILKKIDYDINILYLSFSFSRNKILNNNNISFNEKVNFLSRMIVQSYSLTPKISPKTRNSNKQFFSQGNDKLLNEGVGDIVQFEINEFDVQAFNSLMVSHKNQQKIAFNTLISSNYTKEIYENAAKYYNTYIDIDGKIDKQKIAENMAILDLNYQNQMNLRGSITIIGEPYWSQNHSLMKNCYIYLNIYYNSGNRSSHSGVYHVQNVIQTINSGIFRTKIEILRIPTFLNDLNSLLTKGESITLFSVD